MRFPFLIASPTVEAALRDATEEGGQVLVRAYDVPDHWTVAAKRPWNGTAALNRVGLAAREKFLERERSR